MFAFRDHLDLDPTPADGGRVESAFTDASLDLGGGSGAAEDLAALRAEIGVPLARLHQVHGADVAEVTTPLGLGPDDDAATADAQVTTLPGVALMVRVADCVPVVLVDTATGVLGVAHAGRQGVALDVVAATVERMRTLGARVPCAPGSGPTSADGATRCRTRCATPSRRGPRDLLRDPRRHPALDLGAGVAAQLAATRRSREHRARLHPRGHRPPTPTDATAPLPGRFAELVWRR